MHDAYIILAHRSPWQINELSSYLAGGGADVYIHVDKNSDIASDINTTDKIRLVDGAVRVTWGDWSIVQATLLSVAAMGEKVRQYRYVHLISGQCLPAMSLRKLNTVLDAAYASGKQFIQCKRLPRDDTDGGDGWLHRVQVWYPRWMVSKFSPMHRWFWPYTRKWRRLCIRRPLYYVFKPFYGGAQWWSLTGDCLADIVKYAASHPLYCYFFHHTFCSDEMFFQTTLARTSHCANVSEDNRRFLKWPFKSAPSPMDLGEENWYEVWTSDAFFARKFSMKPGETMKYLKTMEDFP